LCKKSNETLYQLDVVVTLTISIEPRRRDCAATIHFS
jgi:hypothetical protein